jgi:hypothetical protein
MYKEVDFKSMAVYEVECGKMIQFLAVLRIRVQESKNDLQK